MSLLSLLKSKAAIQRRFNTGRNEFFEAIVEWNTIARNVPTTRERVGRDVLDHYGIPAEVGKSRHIFYFLPKTDIQMGDRILVTQLPKTLADIKAELNSLCESYSSSLSSSSTFDLTTSSSSTEISTSESTSNSSSTTVSSSSTSSSTFAFFSSSSSPSSASSSSTDSSETSISSSSSTINLSTSSQSSSSSSTEVSETSILSSSSTFYMFNNQFE